MPAVMEYMNTILGDYYEQFWWEALQRQEALGGHGRNKLWTYKKIKTMFSVEHYVRNIMSKKYRSAFTNSDAGWHQFASKLVDMKEWKKNIE